MSKTEQMDIEADKIVLSNRRTFEIQILHDGTLIVRAPRFATAKSIRKLLDLKRQWILSKREEFQKRKSFAKNCFIDGEKFLLLGDNYELELVDNPQNQLRFADGHFYLDRKLAAGGSELFRRWYKSRAEKVIFDRVNKYSAATGIKFKAFRITEARKRWGSCSSIGTLCFNWRLILMPVAVIDYVVVHELVHLLERNHSRSFWDKVKDYMPSFKERKTWLKENSNLMDYLAG
jgi:predicted metal-dependent hydrolase